MFANVINYLINRKVDDNLHVGRNIRLRKATIKKWFYWFNVHVMVTTHGITVEYDSETLKQLSFNLNEGSRVYANSGYTKYKIEDMLLESEKNDLMVAKKGNSKRKREPYQQYLIKSMRKRVESTLSEISLSS